MLSSVCTPLIIEVFGRTIANISCFLHYIYFGTVLFLCIISPIYDVYSAHPSQFIRTHIVTQLTETCLYIRFVTYGNGKLR